MAQQNSPLTRSIVNPATSVSPLGTKAHQKNDSSLGLVYVDNPYGQRGDRIQKAICDQRFRITIHLSVDAQDDCGYGSHQYTTCISGPTGPTLTAVTEQMRGLLDDEVSTSIVSDPNALSVWPTYVVLNDFNGEPVLAGKYRCGTGEEQGCVDWTRLVDDVKERMNVEQRADALFKKAAFQAGWDNVSTAEYLREKARELSWGLLRARVAMTPAFRQELAELVN